MIFGKINVPITRPRSFWEDPFGIAAFDASPRSWDFEPHYSIEENEQEYIVSFDMPGVPKDKIKVELKDNVLTVSGERENRTKEGKGKNAVRGYSYDSYSQSLSLPSNVDEKGISASYDDGVLTVVLPRVSTPLGRTIEFGTPSAKKGVPGVAKTVE